MPSKLKHKVGDSDSVTVTVTDEMVRAFAALSGDDNPVHLDDEYAARLDSAAGSHTG